MRSPSEAARVTRAARSWRPWAWGLYLALLLGLVGTLMAAAFARRRVARFSPLVTARGGVREALLPDARRRECWHAGSAGPGDAVPVLLASTTPGPSLTPILRAPLLLHGFPAALAYLIVFGETPGWLNRLLQAIFGLSQPPLPLAFSVEALLLFFSIFGLPYFLAYTIVAIGREAAELEYRGGCSAPAPPETLPAG